MTPDTAALRDYARHADATTGEMTLDPDTVRALCDAADEVGRLRAKLDMPCGSCHPCTEWAAETWRRSGGPIPTVWEVSELRAERDASRTAHAALDAELRALRPVKHECSPAVFLLYTDVLSLLGRHAPTTGATP